MNPLVIVEIFNIENKYLTPLSNRTEEVLSRLRTDHLNPEVLANLKKICARYSEVFYLEGKPLTFTNKT